MSIRFLLTFVALLTSIAACAAAEPCPGGRHAISEQKLDLLIANHQNWHRSKFKIGKPSSFRCLDLRNQVFDGLILLEADFSGADLSGASMSGTLLMDGSAVGAIFSNARLSQFQMIDVDASGSRFDRSDLSNSVLGGSRFDDAAFREAVLRGAIVLRAGFLHADFVGADLSGADVSESDFSGSILTGANLSSAIADKAKFVDADLSGATLRNASLLNTDFSGSRFSNVDLAGAYWEAVAPPDSRHLEGLSGLASLRYDCSLDAGLIALRRTLREVGRRAAAHEVTFAIESIRTQRYLRGCINRKSGDVVILHHDRTKIPLGEWRLAVWEQTVGYGLYASRVLLASAACLLAALLFGAAWRRSGECGGWARCSGLRFLLLTMCGLFGFATVGFAVL